MRSDSRREPWCQQDVVFCMHQQEKSTYRAKVFLPGLLERVRVGDEASSQNSAVLPLPGLIAIAP